MFEGIAQHSKKVAPVSPRKLRGLADYVIAVMIVAMPFYAFGTVWASTVLGHYTLVRLWPECLLLGLTIWSVAVCIRDKRVRTMLFSSRIVRIALVYIGLNIVAAMVAHIAGAVSAKAVLYGLLLNVRFLVWFLVVWVAAARSPWLRQSWRWLIVLPLVLVSVFALLQFFVLPNDFLTHFGYSAQTTISPGQTINQDTATIRAQSFLRGPNPLGAYLVLGIGLVAVLTMRRWRKVVSLLLAGLALFVTFSRSAWLGMVVTVVVLVLLKLPKRRVKQMVALGLLIVLLLGAGLFALRNNAGVQNAIFHANEDSTASVTSNEGHSQGIRQGLSDIVAEPIGRGPGSAGPASNYNQLAAARNSENYLLNVGQELGWAGLFLFVWLLCAVGGALLAGRARKLDRGLFATLCGLFVTGLFSYVWVDPTVAYLWWGLAGFALAEHRKPQALRAKKQPEWMVPN